MKQRHFFGLVVMTVAVTITLAGCASFAEMFKEDERRMVGSLDDFVGTWTDREGRSWDFNNDGKLRYANLSTNEVFEYSYDFSRGKLTLKDNTNLGHIEGLQIYDFSISSDGRTLFLTGGKSFSGWSVAGPGWSVNRLIKR